MNVTTYSPKDVILTIGGAYLVGWNAITVTRDSAAFVKVDGIRGKNTRNFNLNTSATITLSLPQSSQWNDVFSAVVAADIESQGNFRCEITLKDGSGSTLVQSVEAYIPNYADITFDGTISNRVWLIQCLSTSVYNVGGNTQPINNLFTNATNAVGKIFKL